MADYDRPDPADCAYCGATSSVWPCTDRTDDGAQGRNITVNRCTVCGRDA